MMEQSPEEQYHGRLRQGRRETLSSMNVSVTIWPTQNTELIGIKLGMIDESLGYNK